MQRPACILVADVLLLSVLSAVHWQQAGGVPVPLFRWTGELRELNERNAARTLQGEQLRIRLAAEKTRAVTAEAAAAEAEALLTVLRSAHQDARMRAREQDETVQQIQEELQQSEQARILAEQRMKIAERNAARAEERALDARHRATEAVLAAQAARMAEATALQALSDLELRLDAKEAQADRLLREAREAEDARLAFEQALREAHAKVMEYEQQLAPDHP